MGEGGQPPPLPVCDRCRHFKVRDRSVTTCGPCRKAYQLQVSVRNVVPAEQDESAVVVYEGCFGLLEDWLKEIKGLTSRREAAKEQKARQEEKPQEKPDSKKEASTKPASPHSSARPPEDKQVQHPQTTSRPSSASKGPHRLPLPPPPPAPAEGQGSASRGYSSQTVKVPTPSQRGPNPKVERSETKPATPDKSKKSSSAEEVEVEADEEPAQPPSQKKERSRRRRRRERSHSSPSSRSREKKKKKREQRKEKERGRRRRRSPTRSSSVTGSRVREAKKAAPVRLKSPAPTPVRDPPARRPPVRNPGRPAVRQGPGWIGKVPWSNHPRWWAGKNKGVTRRAKQELFNRRR